jgi:hypothetical protein
MIDSRKHRLTSPSQQHNTLSAMAFVYHAAAYHAAGRAVREYLFTEGSDESTIKMYCHEQKGGANIDCNCVVTSKLYTVPWWLGHANSSAQDRAAGRL